jgi:hypothetical protein
MKFFNKDILFRSHLGLGDQISCCGIVHYLRIELQKKIHVLTKTRNVQNISFLYKDYEDIEVVEIPGINEDQESNQISKDLNLNVIRTLIPHGRHLSDIYWDKAFYDLLNLDYNIKYTHWSSPKLNERHIIEKYCPKEDFAFVFDDERRGFTFQASTNLQVVKNIPDLNIFEMEPIIKRAKELHIMNGGLLCLIEMLDIPKENQKAFFYPIRDNLNFRNKEKYKIIST